MSLHELVTGSDMCSAGDGAGPSNAMASLANALLGGKGKQQEQLSELPGHGAGAGPSSYAPVPMPTVADAAQHAVHGMQLPGLPGLPGAMAGPANSAGYLDEFLQELGNMPRQGQAMGPMHMPQQPAEFAEFDQIFQQQRGMPHPGMPHPGMPHMGPMPSAVLPLVTQSFRAFLDSSKTRSVFHPHALQLPPEATMLRVEDQCRIRDRSSIMARHLFADQGDAFADEQVGRLLAALRINAAELPAQARELDAIYQQGANAGRQWVDELANHEMAHASQQGAQLPEDGWAQEFSNLRLADDGAAQQAGPEGWAADFAQEQGDKWASEFQSQTEGATVPGVERAMRAGTSTKLTRELAETLRNSSNVKMRNSKFLQFVSKMSQGEAAPAAEWANEFAQQPQQQQPSSSAGWANEFAEQQRAPSTGWASEFAEQQLPGGAQLSADGPAQGDWASEFANGVADQNDVAAWAEQFTSQAEEWEREYNRELQQVTQMREGVSVEQRASEYTFLRDNPFMADHASMGKAKDLFRSGLLSEAVLALEAEVQRNPANVDAWRLLGTVQAENDDDRQAIAAMSRCLLADPSALDVLLALGVSFTNELDQGQALTHLYKWLVQHPVHGQVIAQEPTLADASQKLQHVVHLFSKAATAAPQEADVHSALGVLHNLTRDYDAAATSFRFALSMRPDDYSLWNKLGATLANGNRSGEAITAYQRALDAKPNYMRAWTNMGIAEANLGNYEDSARCYVRALQLNPSAPAVWGYLRTSVVCASRMDLLKAVDDEDVISLATALQL